MLRLVSYDQTDLERSTQARVCCYLWEWPGLLQEILSLKGLRSISQEYLLTTRLQDMLNDGLLAWSTISEEVLFVSKLVEKLSQWKAERGRLK